MDKDPPKIHNLWYSVLASANASLGLTFFTYNITIFGAVMPFLRKFILTTESDFVVVLVTSAPILTAALGALVAGSLSMRIGRRKLMMAFDLVAIVGVILTLFEHLATFLVGRLLEGFSIGVTTVAVSLYFTELTPLAYRGEMTNAPNIFGAVGILLANLLGLIVPSTLAVSETDGAWRVLLSLAMLPPIIRFSNFVLLFRYDTPYYYVSKNKYNKAAYILKKIYNGNIQERIAELVHERDYIQRNGRIPRYKLFTKKFRKALLVCCLIMSLQYIGGLNLILVYSGGIYAVGETPNYSWLSELLSITTAMINFFTAIFSIWTTSQFGRKPLLVGGTFFAGLALLLYGILAEAVSPGSIAPKIFLVLWPIPWNLSLGSVLYVIVAETLPDIGVSTATVCNWVFAFLSLQFFPDARDSMGLGWTFIMFGGVTMIGAILLLMFAKETRGKHRDEILMAYSKTYEPATVTADRQLPQLTQDPSAPYQDPSMPQKPELPVPTPEAQNPQQIELGQYAPIEQGLKENAVTQV